MDFNFKFRGPMNTRFFICMMSLVFFLNCESNQKMTGTARSASNKNTKSETGAKGVENNSDLKTGADRASGASDKEAFLGNSVFGTRKGDVNGGIIEEIRSLGDLGKPDEMARQGADIAILNVCSQCAATGIGASFIQAKDKMALKFRPAIGGDPVLLDATPELITSIVNEGKISFHATFLPDGDYSVTLCQKGESFPPLAGACNFWTKADLDSKNCRDLYVNWLPKTDPTITVKSGSIASAKDGVKSNPTNSWEPVWTYVKEAEDLVLARYPGLPILPIIFDSNDNPMNMDFATREAIGCAAKVSPLIIDMANTGINMSAPLSGVDFDINADGKLDRISWPLEDTAMFLFIDKNSDGNVNNGGELFGDHTIGPDGIVAPNGFAALKKYDDNFDNVIDKNDKAFNTIIKFWTDKNHNAKVESGEAKTFEELGIVSIDLSYVEVHEYDRYGNDNALRSVIRLQNGEYRLIFDIWFRPVPKI